jgi:hypothetical protein
MTTPNLQFRIRGMTTPNLQFRIRGMTTPNLQFRMTCISNPHPQFITKVVLLNTAKIKFVSDLRQVGGFLRVILFPLTIKLTTTI